MCTPIFQIDAFTTRRFAGNPAAVMLMDGFLDDAVLQAIAALTNSSEAESRPGRSVLDAGCGFGRNLVYFFREGYEVFGADSDPC